MLSLRSLPIQAILRSCEVFVCVHATPRAGKSGLWEQNKDSSCLEILQTGMSAERKSGAKPCMQTVPKPDPITCHRMLQKPLGLVARGQKCWR